MALIPLGYKELMASEKSLGTPPLEGFGIIHFINITICFHRLRFDF
jgi:hypothetical protein